MKRLLTAVVGAVLLAALFSVDSFAAEITIKGNLARTIEPGGWLIVSGSDKYLLINAQKFQRESWFTENAAVEATGEVRKDVVTTFQEGIPFEARTLVPATAQSGDKRTDTKAITRVKVIGDAVVRVQPDTAILMISVVTQNTLALTAQQQNATQTEAVIRTVKAAAGPGAEVKTGGYSLVPQRIYKENQPPTITGYEARNTVSVTLSDLNKVGAVIDAAANAGANNIDSVSFTLRNDEAAKNQALTDATREAMNKAKTIATALGGRVTRIADVEELGYVRPIPIYDRMEARSSVAMAAPSTPIEVGTLEVTAQVQILAEVE
jgi:uncharacterized protein